MRGRRPEPIRVLIADDHALFRRGLEMVLEEEDDIDLVGQASDGTEAVAVAGESLPDVVLMDIRMPKVSGIEACRATKEVAPSAKIVRAIGRRAGGNLSASIDVEGGVPPASPIPTPKRVSSSCQ